MKEYDSLKLENQLCFPLYAASKEIIKKYKPFLDKIDLTYTQYIVMMVLWECNEINVKTLGEKLYLDSGTLTPLLRKLEDKKYIKRTRYNNDERNLIITLTDSGIRLKDQCTSIPYNVGACLNLNENDAKKLYEILYKLLDNLSG